MRGNSTLWMSLCQVVLMLILVQPALASYTKIASDCEASPDQDTVTSTAIDITGADFVVIVVATFAQNNSVSDSEMNTISTAPPTAGATAADTRLRMFYIANPSTSATYTVTVANVNSSFPSVCVIAFSGSDTSTPFDTESTPAVDASDTTIQPGSVDPTGADSLMVTGLAADAAFGTPSIDGSYTMDGSVDAGANNSALAIAYKVKTDSNAENPTWTTGFSTAKVADHASFDAAAAGGAARQPCCLLGVFD